MGSRPIGRTSRVSGFTMRPRVSTAPSKGASSRSPRTTGEVPVRRAISKRASETARTMTVVLAAIDPQGGTGHLHFGLTGTSEFGGYVTPNPEKKPLISAICSLAAQEADLTDHHGIRITSGGDAAAGL